MPSLLDIFSPEDQRLLAILAISAATAGFALWFAGIKIAHFSVSIFLGLIGAAVAATQLPSTFGIHPVTSALLGFIAVALIGAMTFRILQGVVLAACIALAVAAVFYQNHTTPPTALVAASQSSAPNPQPSALSTQDLLIRTDRLPAQPATNVTAKHSNLSDFARKLTLRWNALTATDQHRILIASIGAALCTLLLAFTFQRPTTWIATALLGGLLFLTALHTLTLLYAPQYEHFFPPSPLARYLALTLFTSLGLLLQYKLFWPAPQKTNPLPQLENPLYRGPQPYSITPPG